MSKSMMHKEPSLAALRKRAEKLKLPECEECGAVANLHIHHMDMNPANNAPSNLKTFCASCHLRWHWKHGNHRASMQMPPQSCIVCEKALPRLWGGMCQKHYQRFRKYGDPLMTKLKIGSSFELVRETPGAPCGPG